MATLDDRERHTLKRVKSFCEQAEEMAIELAEFDDLPEFWQGAPDDPEDNVTWLKERGGKEAKRLNDLLAIADSPEEQEG